MNLSKSFLTPLNAPDQSSKSLRIFTNVFTTYCKDHVQSESYLDTSINFPQTNRTVVSLCLLTSDFCSSLPDKDINFSPQ